jgi:hypothetical protein
MFGLLDRAAQLTNLKRETPGPEPLTREAALKMTALAARQRESGIDVLCAAAPFKITRGRCHIPYERVVCPRDRGVSPCLQF